MAGGLWGSGIGFYSSTDPSLDRPLLELKRVVSPLIGSSADPHSRRTCHVMPVLEDRPASFPDEVD